MAKNTAPAETVKIEGVYKAKGGEKLPVCITKHGNGIEMSGPCSELLLQAAVDSRFDDCKVVEKENEYVSKVNFRLYDGKMMKTTIQVRAFPNGKVVATLA